VLTELEDVEPREQQRRGTTNREDDTDQDDRDEEEDNDDGKTKTGTTGIRPGRVADQSTGTTETTPKAAGRTVTARGTTTRDQQGTTPRNNDTTEPRGDNGIAKERWDDRRQGNGRQQTGRRQEMLRVQVERPGGE
jgi:hypothetical protein